MAEEKEKVTEEAVEQAAKKTTTRKRAVARKTSDTEASAEKKASTVKKASAEKKASAAKKASTVKKASVEKKASEEAELSTDAPVAEKPKRTVRKRSTAKATEAEAAVDTAAAGAGEVIGTETVEKPAEQTAEEKTTKKTSEKTSEKKTAASGRTTGKKNSTKTTTAGKRTAKKGKAAEEQTVEKPVAINSEEKEAVEAAAVEQVSAEKPSEESKQHTEQKSNGGKQKGRTIVLHRHGDPRHKDSKEKEASGKNEHTVSRKNQIHDKAEQKTLKEEQNIPRTERRLVKDEAENSAKSADDEQKTLHEEPKALNEEQKAPQTEQKQEPKQEAPLRAVHGILEVMPDGFGFVRSDNFLPGDHDVYVNPSFMKRYGLRTGDMIDGNCKAKQPNDQQRYSALNFIDTVNGKPLSVIQSRRGFESLTPIFPNQRIRLEVPGEKAPTALRILDLLAPIGKGQRGMIVSPPKAGKTTLIKQVAKAIVKNEPSMHLLILLIDERPEEVTDMKEEVEGGMVQVIYSTFDETPEHHKKVAEMTIERARRLVETGEDVTILLDSITRLARAYNLVEPTSGRTLSGGLDPAALHMPKRFFGAARNMREGGSLTILATALIDTGSRMDDVIYEEFKGTGNMELVLDRELQERRIFPAIDILRSGTRRDDLLLTDIEQKAVDLIHKRTSDEKAGSVEEVITLFERTENNQEVCEFLVNGKPFARPASNRLVIKVNPRNQG